MSCLMVMTSNESETELWLLLLCGGLQWYHLELYKVLYVHIDGLLYMHIQNLQGKGIEIQI